MRLCCKVDNDVRLLLLEELIHALTVTDIELHEAEVRVVHNGSKCAEIACICKFVKTDNSVVRISVQHVEHEV